MHPLFRLALRNLLRYRSRTLATTLGVALGIAAVLATLSIGDNVEANVRGALQAAAGRASLLVTPGAEGRAVFPVAEVLPTVQQTPGVSRAYPVLNVRAEPVRDIQVQADSVLPGVDSGFQLSGRRTDVPEDLPAELAAGRLPEAGSMGVALAEGFARSRGVAVGDPITFASQVGELTFTVTGLLDDSLGYPTTNGGRVGIAALADLQEALRLPGRASFIEVITEPGVSTQVQEALRARLGEAYAVTLPAGSGNLATGVVDTLQSGLQILAATLIALGGFMAYNTFSASVVERRREFALLRTVCLTRAQVQRLALAEALLVSLLGIFVGLLLGVGLSAAITYLNALTLGFEFRTLVVPVRSVVIASLVGVGVSLLAGLLPARAASNTHPLAAVRQSSGAPSLRAPLWGWGLLAAGIGAALAPWEGRLAVLGAALAMGLLFTGVSLTTPALLRPTLKLMTPLLRRLFGVSGTLGSSFSLRNAARNGVAVGAIVVGMGLTIGVGAMVAGINTAIRSWVDTTVVGDLFVTAPVNFPEGFPEAVRARVPQIDEVSGVGLRVVRFMPEAAPEDADEGRGRTRGAAGRSVALVLVDPERFNPEGGFGRFQFIPGQGDAADAYATLRAGGQVLAANTMLDRFGVSRGDEVTLRTNKGLRDFRVGGVVVDFTGGGEAFVASLADAELFGGGTPDLFVMTLVPGADPEAAREALLAAFPELYLDVTLNQSYRQRILTLTQQTFSTTNGLLALAIFIAALGVANTLGMNLATRQHEIAVLRTLGLTRRGVGHLVTAEGIVIVTLGTVLGILAGVILSSVITAGAGALTGFRIEPVYPWRLIAVALLSSPVVGLLASLAPARRAARLSPVAAIGGA
jgi:putative ABC transport system permease protein